MSDVLRDDPMIPSTALLRVWASDSANTACWGLAAIADELDRLRFTRPCPKDCNWPFCGHDERATKVIEALLECGWTPPTDGSPVEHETKERQ